MKPDPEKYQNGCVMCVSRFRDFGQNMSQTLLQTVVFRYFFATPFARGRPEINSEHAFKAEMVAFRGIRGRNFGKTWKSIPETYQIRQVA